MIRVGVTGGIGSGKSAVCKLFEGLGAPVYYSDARAREIMNADGKVRQAIVGLLGVEAYSLGRLNSTYVAEKVFADKELLASLDAIVHPEVALDFEAWALRSTDRAYAVLESAILFESGLDRLVDRIVAVSAPVEVRIERVLARARGSGEPVTGREEVMRVDAGGPVTGREEVMRRMANQMTDAEREARADYRIDNNGTLAELAVQVQLLDKQFKQ